MKIYSPELIDLIGGSKEMYERLYAIADKKPEIVSPAEFKRWLFIIKHAEELAKQLTELSHH